MPKFSYFVVWLDKALEIKAKACWFKRYLLEFILFYIYYQILLFVIECARLQWYSRTYRRATCGDRHSCKVSISWNKKWSKYLIIGRTQIWTFSYMEFLFGNYFSWIFLQHFCFFTIKTHNIKSLLWFVLTDSFQALRKTM